MGVAEDKTSLYLSNLEVRKKTTGNLCNEKPVFCENGTSLVVPCDKSCHLYNTATGNHTRELFQCADDIISCQLHPLDSSLVIAITENGEVIVFNLETNEIEHSCKLVLNKKFMIKHNPPKFKSEDETGDEYLNWGTQPLDSLSHRKFVYAEVKAYQNNPNIIFIWASWSLRDEKKSHLSVFTYNRGKHTGFVHLRNDGLKKCFLNFTVGTIQGKDIFLGMSNSFVHITNFDIKKTNVHKRHHIGMNVYLTCIALHPVEWSFATGDSLGRITIWRNIFENYPLKEVFHWHSLPVHDMFFTSFGNYIYSGGEENVLVKWSVSSRTRDFLPRLSSNILHISGTADASLLSVSTMDNKILIIDSNFKNISAIQHYSKWSALKVESDLDIFTIDPRSNCLVLNGKTGHIQFLSLNENGKFIYTFDVTNRNFVVSVSYAAIKHTEVTHARFSKNGKWLITVELRQEESVKECRLKFWVFCDKENSFKLNTNVELPHGEFKVYSLEVSPDDTVATTGGDKKFRLWSSFNYQEGSRVKELWSVTHVQKYRNLSCSALDFSKDASLVAVTFDHVLTIWDTDSCSLQCSLSVPYRKEKLISVKFGNNEMSHLVVTGTEFSVSTWNTITLSMIWTVPLKVSLLISDPFSIYMAVFSKNNDMIIFNPGSPSPNLIKKNVSDSSVKAAQCLLSESGSFCMYFLTADQELFTVEAEESVTSETSSYIPKTLLTPYSRQLAIIQSRTEKEKEKIQINKNNNQVVSSLLDSPAHTLPNPSLLCSDILKGMLVFCNSQLGTTSLKERKDEEYKEANKSQVEDTQVDMNQIEVKLLKAVNAIFA